VNVRLKTNLILAGGRFLARESVVDIELVPPHLRDPAHIDRDLENRGLALLLRDLSYQSEPKLDSSGVLTRYPVQVMAGELIDLTQIPASRRQAMVEGEDFKTNWSFADQAEVRRAARETYLDQFTVEPVAATWRSR
jgi:hypothetical protein